MQFTVDLSHINANSYKVIHLQRLFDSEPWSSLDLNILKGLDFDKTLQQHANEAFVLLCQGVSDINLLQMLALLNDTHNDYATFGDLVAKNLWKSILSDTVSFNALIKILIKPLSFGLIAPKLKTQARHTHWPDEHLQKFVLCIFDKNAEQYAKWCIDCYQPPQFWAQKYELDLPSEFAKKAQIHWFNHYFNLPNREFEHYEPSIKSLIPNHSTKAQEAFALMLIDYPALITRAKQDDTLWSHLTALYQFLKKQSQAIDFLQKLTTIQRQRLKEWVGAGNYNALEKLVNIIAKEKGEFDNKKGSISVNRYIFWKNYQHHLLDYCLLLPQSYASYAKQYPDVNTKILQNYHSEYNEPCVLLRFENHYFIQMLIKKADQTNLLMTSEVERIDKALQSVYFDADILDDIEICLEHDHVYLWQYALYTTLKDQYDILPSQAARQPDADKWQERQQKLKNWRKHR